MLPMWQDVMSLLMVGREGVQTACLPPAHLHTGRWAPMPNMPACPPASPPCPCPTWLWCVWACWNMWWNVLEHVLGCSDMCYAAPTLPSSPHLIRPRPPHFTPLPPPLSPSPPPLVKTQEDANAALQPVQLSGDDFRETRTLLVGLQEQQQEVDLEEEMMEQE